MRKVSLLIGIMLLLSGIVSAGLYITQSGVAYASTVVSSVYLTLAILFIIVGFIFLLSSVRIPKVRIP